MKVHPVIAGQVALARTLVEKVEARAAGTERLVREVLEKEASTRLKAEALAVENANLQARLLEVPPVREVERIVHVPVEVVRVKTVRVEVPVEVTKEVRVEVPVRDAELEARVDAEATESARLRRELAAAKRQAQAVYISQIHSAAMKGRADNLAASMPDVDPSVIAAMSAQKVSRQRFSSSIHSRACGGKK